jgi:hypothetical protein
MIDTKLCALCDTLCPVGADGAFDPHGNCDGGLLAPTRAYELWAYRRDGDQWRYETRHARRLVVAVRKAIRVRRRACLAGVRA